MLSEANHTEKDKYYMMLRKWQPTPVFLPEEIHGHRSRAGYSPWGHKESQRLSD